MQSVRTSFRIIQLIQDFGGASLNEVADQLDLAKSTVHNYLGTLEAMGYVVEQDETYRLGLRFLTHGMAAKNSLRVSEVVQQSLSTLSQDISQPAWWIAEEFGRGIFLAKSVPEDGAESYGSVGKRSYLHTHAPGKAILARLPREEVQKIVDYHGLPKHTTETMTDEATLMRELETVRDQGFAVSEGEAALAVRSVGVAFEDPQGRRHGIGVFGYTHDFDGENRDENIPSRLNEVVEDIGSSLSKENR
ncbi:IclR family transcriptional regulator [Halorientalis salina]|uniref:IclR family transcriptional regulator n=1 Tax=Halorientalis salina TaxID=2932266 RepID=UPI00145F6FE7|nr:IclR family transcriptional regulator [Halorientalis salina]